MSRCRFYAKALLSQAIREENEPPEGARLAKAELLSIECQASARRTPRLPLEWENDGKHVENARERALSRHFVARF